MRQIGSMPVPPELRGFNGNVGSHGFLQMLGPRKTLAISKSSRFLYAFFAMDLWYRLLWQVLMMVLASPGEMRRERVMADRLSEKRPRVKKRHLQLGQRLRRESILGDGSNDTMIQQEVQRNAV